MKFEIYTDETQEICPQATYRWRLLASDGQVMATSRESYATLKDIRRAITALQASIPVARIVGPASVDARSLS